MDPLHVLQAVVLPLVGKITQGAGKRFNIRILHSIKYGYMSQSIFANQDVPVGEDFSIAEFNLS